MRVVVDAQVIKGYFIESVLNLKSDLTGDAQPLFERIGNEDIVYTDDGGHIEYEWKQIVEPEWFDAWLANQLQNGSVIRLPTDTYHELKRRLERLGFPITGSRDFWYIRTAMQVVSIFRSVHADKRAPISYIITEDLDFFDPQNKGRIRGEHRVNALLSCDGPVARYLLRNEHIAVNCVAVYCHNFDGD